MNNKTWVLLLLAIASTRAKSYQRSHRTVEIEPGLSDDPIRFCVISHKELKKCHLLKDSIDSRSIYPKFDCVLKASHEECFKTIKQGLADIITVDGTLVLAAQNNHQLTPIVSEIYGDLGSAFYSVAIVKKNSIYKSLKDLRGLRSCHTGFGPARNAGYNAPLYNLIKLGLIKQDDCPYSTALSEFFSGGSCVPGAKLQSHKLPEEIVVKLCSHCGGEGPHRCTESVQEPYSNHKGSFRCLAEGKGDVAFAKHISVEKNTDGRNLEEWASKLKSKDFELLCPNGGRAPVGEFRNCNLAYLPSRMVVTSNSKTRKEIEKIADALVVLSKIYSKFTDDLKLFGVFEGESDLLFKDTASALVATTFEKELLEDYVKMVNVVKECGK